MAESSFDLEHFGSLCQSLADKDRAKIEEFAPLVFKDIDKNGNGILDKEEILEFAKCISNDAEKTTSEMMADLDYNNDGQIEESEWKTFWLAKAGFE